MSATGPSYGPGDPVSLLTKNGLQVTTGAADLAMSTYYNANYCRRVVAQGSGTVFIHRVGDAVNAAISYAVVAGTIIDGEIDLIGGTTNYASATNGLVLNIEL